MSVWGSKKKGDEMGTLFKGHRTTFITQQNKVSQCAPESTLYHQSVQREGRNDQWDGFISKRDTQHQQNVTPWAASVLNQNCMSDGRLVSDAPSSPRPPPTRRFFRGISRPIRLHTSIPVLTVRILGPVLFTFMQQRHFHFHLVILNFVPCKFLSTMLQKRL